MVCWIYASCWHRGVSAAVLLGWLLLVLTVLRAYDFQVTARAKVESPPLASLHMPYCTLFLCSASFLSNSD